jgi:hypothetical protein
VVYYHHDSLTGFRTRGGANHEQHEKANFTNIALSVVWPYSVAHEREDRFYRKGTKNAKKSYETFAPCASWR